MGCDDKCIGYYCLLNVYKRLNHVQKALNTIAIFLRDVFSLALFRRTIRVSQAIVTVSFWLISHISSLLVRLSRVSWTRVFVILAVSESAVYYIAPIGEFACIMLR